jgi:HK97 family phage major capsid protein
VLPHNRGAFQTGDFFMFNFGSIEAKREQYLQTAKNILSKAEAEGRDLTKAEQRDYDGLLEKIGAMEATLKDGARVRDLVGSISQASPHQWPSVTVSDPNAGRGLGRMCLSLAATRGISGSAAAEYAERRFGDSGVAKALAAGVGSAGGFTVPENYVAELIEFLRPASVVRRMGARQIPLNNGSATMPKLTSGAQAGYVGENQDIEVTEASFGQLKMSAKKLAALVPISNDLIRFSSPQADAIVRDDLIGAVAQAEDSNFLRSDPSSLGAGSKPDQCECDSEPGER